jgi:DNA ligase-1
MLQFAARKMIDVRYHRGIELPTHALWLDPADARPRAFVSHAHSDHIAAHAEVITSRGTAQLMRARLGGERREHVLDFGQRADFGSFAITLFPAGHIFGSAQSFIETDAGSLLYTGDFKLRASLSAEAAEWRHAETLIMETTFGLPRYRLPPTERVIAEMVEFCREAIDESAVPVLLGYSLGKSQEILCALLAAGLTPMLHGAVFKMTEIYRKLRPDFPTGYVRYGAGEVAGKVLVCPPSANRSLMLTRIKNRRVAVLTGWALDPGAIFRYQCDAAFPLSDHADYDDLLRYVELVQPKRVLTLHGFAAAFARDLRERGYEAWALSEENQLELNLARPQIARMEESPPHFSPSAKSALSAVNPSASSPASEAPRSEFQHFAGVGLQIAATTSKLRKIEILSSYLRSLDATQLPLAARYLTGSAFARSDPRVLQVGWAVIKRALLATSRIGEQRFRELSRLHSDAGRTAYEALLERTPAPGVPPFSLAASAAFFDRLHQTRGPIAKGELLRLQFDALDALEGSYLVRILTGDLRIGLKEGLVEDAIAAAFGASAEEVREAAMLLGGIGETASLASQGRLGEATLHLFRPIKCMLASPEPTANAVWMRLSNSPAWAEDKYDGIRAQIHLGGGRAEIFTRDLRCVTEQFTELAQATATFDRDAIFDGEIVAFEAGRKLTFFDLQRRLGRKSSDDLFLGASDVPVIFKAFDLLYIGGRSLLKTPLHERRALLEGLALPPRFESAPTIAIDSAAAIDAAFTASRQRGNEGLIIKDSGTLYTPGRRGFGWVKLKKALATLDVVVVGAASGHGRRSHVLSDYTFAIRDDATGALLTIGKAYSGLTDEEIEELTAHFTASTIRQAGRYREVRPEIVLEIAFDSVQPSPRHASGLALRFPRIKAIRRDKPPAEIDTLSFARSLVSASDAAPHPPPRA